MIQVLQIRVGDICINSHIQFNIDTTGYTYIYKYVYTHRLIIPTYIFLLCLLRVPTRNQIPEATSTFSTKILLSLLEHIQHPDPIIFTEELAPFSNKLKEDSLKKWLILRLGQKIYKMSWEHLVVPKIKIASKTKSPTLTEVSERGTAAN